MHNLIRTLSIVAAGLSLSACGISGNLRYHEGFADFGSPGMGQTDRELALSLGPLPLKIARALTKHDPELSTMLKGLKGVRVYTYEIDGDPYRVMRRLESAWTRLSSRGWMPIATVRDDGELVSVLVRAGREDRVRGMAVMVQEEDEVVLINLIGDFRPEMFNAFMTELDIDAPMLALR